MKMYTLRSQFYVLKCTNLTNYTSTRPSLIPTSTLPSKTVTNIQRQTPALTKSNYVHNKITLIRELDPESRNLSNPTHGIEYPRCLIIGAVSVGFVLLLMGVSDQKALAFGPEGPLVEEFWDNVRRYAIYALTVSTGALYTIFQPIFELLKNPISAILILVILGGGLYVVSQVVSAMVGITDFSYDYSY
ncbi:hypothetical protein TIFTF001_006160 [Ficus carica]|uniref:Uncharacterized protein ycf33 n=1 Tax=Ficus carica TaxID=3494 RepID=A0AA88A3J7_FICCA|nr:hypothetical protein TIFTF001_006160 [Ficus carica]